MLTEQQRIEALLAKQLVLLRDIADQLATTNQLLQRLVDAQEPSATYPQPTAVDVRIS
jgi:L-lysine 2,3-aminomutase